MAALGKLLDEEQRSNTTSQKTIKDLRKTIKDLRRQLADALCKQTAQEIDLIQLRFDKNYLTKCLKSKDEQIAEQNEELLDLRTQVAALTDCAKQRASGGSSGRKKQLARRREQSP